MTTATQPVSQTLTAQQRRALLRPISPPSLGTAIGIVAFVAVVAWAATGTDLSVQRLVKGIPNIIRFIIDLWPPERDYWTKMYPAIRTTLQMAVMGTFLSVILAFPIGLLAAKNTAPHAAIYQVTRFFLNVVRAVPSLVWAIVIVAAIGFGPFAGVLALGVGGLGTLGKLYAEAIEAISPRPVEALCATGSPSLSVFSFAVLPQALPLLVSYTLLDFEANIRVATILGIVGAGGIGFELQASFSLFRFHQVLTIILEIIIMVTIIDRLSAFVRSRIT